MTAELLDKLERDKNKNYHGTMLFNPYPLPTFLFEEPLDVPQAVRSPTAKVWSTFVYPSYPRYILAIPGIPGIPAIS